MRISVVIPCRNEVLYIEECIQAIFAAILPEKVTLRVFVVDGMSDDGTRDVVNSLISEYSDLELIENTKKLTPYAFNLGIHAAKCDFVQIIGARHIISENYLINAFNILQKDTSCWCVGGKIENVFINETGEIISKAMSTKLGMGIGNFRTLTESGYTDTVTSPMYPYWVFEKIGFFDEELIRNQDDDFNYRVTKAGGKIYFDASISLKYYVRGNFKNLQKQFYQYGYWKVFVNKKHGAVTTIRQMIPPVFVTYVLLYVFTWLLGDLFGGISSFPLLVYLILVLYMSSKIQQENKKLPLWEIAKTFPIIHVSYGWGYLNGLLDFVILRKKPSDSNKSLSR